MEPRKEHYSGDGLGGRMGEEETGEMLAALFLHPPPASVPVNLVHNAPIEGTSPISTRGYICLTVHCTAVGGNLLGPATCRLHESSQTWPHPG